MSLITMDEEFINMDEKYIVDFKDVRNISNRINVYNIYIIFRLSRRKM
jgi:hypothetical protein